MKNDMFKTSYATLLTSCALCLVLAGCGHNTPVAVPSEKQVVQFDKELLKDCPVLTKPKSPTDMDLRDWSASVLDAYDACATNKKKLNVEVRKALNVK